MTDSIRVRHTVSGQIAEVPRHIYEHEQLGAYLEKVDADAKPYVPELHIPREAKKPQKDELIFNEPDRPNDTKDEN